jgi:zinc transporter ZupT
MACSVCFDAKDGTRGAFLWTTVFLSLVPLAMIAGGIYTLKYFSSKNTAQAKS